MTGIELILNTVCNLTLCAPNQTLPLYYVQPDYQAVKIKQDLEIKAAKEMINGKHLKVSTFKDSVRSWFDINEHGKIVGRGFAFDVLNHLSKRLNFTYEILLPRNYSTKVVHQKVMESLLVEMLKEDKIDLAAAFLSFTTERKDLIKFELELDTVNCWSMDKSFHPSGDAMLQPQHADKDTLKLFSADIWVYFLLTLILYVACLVLLTRVRSKLINDDERSFTIISSLSYAYRIMTKQDIQQSPKASSTRILMMTWTLFTMLVSYYYGAYISQLYTLTAVSQNGAMRHELISLDGSKTNVDNNDFVSCDSDFSLDYLIKRPSGFAYPPKSNLNILFGSEIRKLYHTGFLRHSFRKYINLLKKTCRAKWSANKHSLKLVDLPALSYSWVGGVGAACAVFLMELLLNIFTKSKPEELPPETLSEELDGVVVQRPTGPPARRAGPPRSPTSPFQQRIVNGRRYLLSRTRDGEVRFIPVDTLSALLYDLDLYDKG